MVAYINHQKKHHASNEIDGELEDVLSIMMACQETNRK